MKIIDRILNSAYFAEQPPVLIDIGASGEINTKWKQIAPYSICMAFDADDREFIVTESKTDSYKKLIVVNRIVTNDQGKKQADFYLTDSPFCSSLLEPDQSKLSPWIFKDLFRVGKIASLPTVTLQESLEKAAIYYIDWFKADTQGTDLRLYLSLPESVQSGILAAEFEPGIIDAYKGEDKLYTVMNQMHMHNFWLSSLKVQGMQRLSTDYCDKIGLSISKRILRKTPGWAEATYLRQPKLDSPRNMLMLFVFALLERQYGFALEITDLASKHYPDEIFQDCKKDVWKALRKEKMKIPLVIFKRQLNKLFSKIHD
ncbi:MAG: hypothetical protein ACHQET_08375 [Chitinophagales bacterium]